MLCVIENCHHGISINYCIFFSEEIIIHEPPPTPLSISPVLKSQPAIQLYLNACKQFRLTPIKSVKEGLKKTQLACKYMTFQRKDLEAIAVALMVIHGLSLSFSVCVCLFVCLSLSLSLCLSLSFSLSLSLSLSLSPSLSLSLSLPVFNLINSEAIAEVRWDLKVSSLSLSHLKISENL